MSIAPVMLDLINEKLRGAVTRDIITPECCFKACKKESAVMLVLRYSNGSTDVFSLCKEDARKVRDSHPSMLERTQRQSVFMYPTY